jgi:sugar lactone lactonase YvrE
MTSTLVLDQVPVGAVDVTGFAYAGKCVTSVGAAPTWFTQQLSTIIAADGTTNIQLEFAPAGHATGTADFTGTVYRDVVTIAGLKNQAGETDGTGAAARFNRPQGLGSDGTNVYVADGVGKTIRMVTPTGVVTTIAGNPNATGPGVDGVGAAATFNHPEGVAADMLGNLYVTDSFDHTIRKIVLATGAVTTIAGTAGVSGTADGHGTAAQFNTPYGVAADLNGNVYVADTANSTVRLISPAGDVTTVAGVPGTGGSKDGAKGLGLLGGPVGIAVDVNDGLIFVADNATIREIDISSGFIWTLAGDPTTPGAADGPTAHFGGLYGLAFDQSRRVLYASDQLEGDIRQIDVDTGFAWTLAGTPDARGVRDGNGPNAFFSLNIGLAADAVGNVFVGETSGAVIRRLSAPPPSN